jgi:hypothetical protein
MVRKRIDPEIKALHRRVALLEDTQESIIAALAPDDYAMAQKAAAGLAVAEIVDETGRAAEAFREQFMKNYTDILNGTLNPVELLLSCVNYATINNAADRGEPIPNFPGKDDGKPVRVYIVSE